MAIAGVFLALLLAPSVQTWAQMPGGKTVQVSHKTQMLNGKRYFVHIVDQGQTVYAIARAYGLKEVEAVTKKDIHFLHVGDTVWLPCKGQRLSDGTLAPAASTRAATPATPAPSTPAETATTPAQPAAQSVATASIRPRVNSQSIVVSLMIPLYLSQMDKISTSKFDVEQRGKITYKSFEFVQFYEGLQLGLEQLEKKGYNVTLNVVDVEESTPEAVEAAFRSHNVAQSDLLIALLTRQPFEKAAQLARDAQLFIVNPVSDRSEIVQGNPYVFKCMPSAQAYAHAIVRTIRNSMTNSPVYIIHSGAKSESAMQQALVAELEKQPAVPYTLFNWSSAAKLTTALKGSPHAAVVSIYQQDRSKNRIYVSQLLNKLASFKSKTPTLFSVADWSVEQPDVDFSQLQNLSYHTFYSDWDRADAAQKDFIKRFQERYKTEPVNTYACMANDIILFFVTGLQQKGTDFFRQPVLPKPQGMLGTFHFAPAAEGSGFENQAATLYRMTDYRFNPIP